MASLNSLDYGTPKRTSETLVTLEVDGVSVTGITTPSIPCPLPTTPLFPVIVGCEFPCQ